MALPLDILVDIGRATDNLTRVNLCLASKDYYHEARQRERVYSDPIVVDFEAKLSPMMNEKFDSIFSSIKHKHKVFRYILSHKYAFMEASTRSNHRLLDICIDKLDEFEKFHMNVKKYRRVLVSWLARG